MKWKPVVGYEDLYEVSAFGIVRRREDSPFAKGCKQLSLRLTKDSPYYRVKLSRSGKKSLVAVHNIVAAAFIGPCPEGKEVNHLDGDQKNNYYKNLEYLTRSENIRHSRRVLGRGQVCSREVLARVSELLKSGLSQSEVSRRLGVSQASVVSRIARGVHWSQRKSYYDLDN